MNLDINKYSTESLEMIDRLANRQLESIFTSIRETTNKSYILISVILSIQSFVINKIISGSDVLLYGVFFCLMLLPTIILINNLMPTKLDFPGANPSSMIHEYYEKRKDNQIKYLLKFRIIDLNESIKVNSEQMVNRTTRLKNSIISFLVVLVLGFVFWLLCAKCLVG